RFLAAKAVRSQQRWHRREEEALVMKTLLEGNEPNWERLRPEIDEALYELNERDREPILLRFFENQSLADIGAMIGLTENAARMRLERALERLRVRLARRGLTSTTAALAFALTHQPAIAAPAGLVANVASVAPAALTSVTVGPGGLALSTLGSIGSLMNTTKTILGFAALAAAIGVGAFIGAQSRPSASRFEILPAHATGGAGPHEKSAQLRQATAGLPLAADSSTSKRGRALTEPSDQISQAQRLRVLVELQRRGLAQPGINFVSQNGDLSPAFVELFALTSAEQEKLQRGLEDALDQLAFLEQQHARITRQPNGDVVVEIAAFPERGGAVYDQLIGAFADTLGTERHEAFVTLGLDQVERVLGRFGTPARSLTFSRKADVNGEPRYVMRENYQLPDQSGNHTSGPMTLAQIKERAGTVGRFLPPDFNSESRNEPE
ncbi:MAG TPA: sigma-70 family RNA polymerase sigma factor, partial [Candidatus Synoicihabitans sp.]|nr:sigma-70 family RNA polymerase sigma factor [Candidatus Synoicihabitans sp.]